MRQKTLFKLSQFTSEHGGSLLLKKTRKGARPLSFKNPLKLVLKAAIPKNMTLLSHRAKIDINFMRFAEKFHVRIYEKAIAHDHIHFIALFKSRSIYNGFIRALTGALALALKIKWKLRPWSRIVHWGKAFKIAIAYIKQNHQEATRQIPYQPRKKRILRV